MSDDSGRPLGLGCNEGLGPLPERAAFEAAAEAEGMVTHRDPEWHAFGGQIEDDRDYYNARTGAAWWAWKVSAAATRENCAKLADEYATRGGSNFAVWFRKLAAAIRA